MKLLIADCETTHLLSYRGCIHELALMVVINNEIVEKAVFRIAPHEKAEIDLQALKVSGTDLETIQGYPHRTEAFNAFVALLEKYVDPYDPKDKFHLAGWNCAFFDEPFIRNFFLLEDSGQYGCFFFNGAIDILALSAHYLAPIRSRMPSFKLSRVCKTLNIPVADDSLHGALYDCELAFEVYKKVRGKNIDEW